jgi:topoisomerase-4 subunit B
VHIATLICALFVRHFRPLVTAGHVFVAMPPLYRIDIGKEVFYALDEGEKQGILDRIEAEKKRGKVNVQRFKGLGEMNPLQLRETTMDPDTRRLVQLALDPGDSTNEMMDMLLAKKRASDRKSWLEKKGDLAEVV